MRFLNGKTLTLKVISLLLAGFGASALACSPANATPESGAAHAATTSTPECVFVPEAPVKACPRVVSDGALVYGSGYIRWTTGSAPTTLDVRLEENLGGQWVRITYSLSTAPGDKIIQMETEALTGTASGKRACIEYAFNHNPMTTIKCRS